MLFAYLILSLAIPILIWAFGYREALKDIEWKNFLKIGLIFVVFVAITTFLFKVGLLTRNSLEMLLQFWPIALLIVGVFKILPTRFYNMQIGILCLGVFNVYLHYFERHWRKIWIFNERLFVTMVFFQGIIPYLIIIFAIICVFIQKLRTDSKSRIK